MSNNYFISHNFSSNQNYRMFMTKNADNIIENNQLNSICNNCNPNIMNIKSASLPVIEISDLKKNYLNQTIIQKNKIAPYLF